MPLLNRTSLLTNGTLMRRRWLSGIACMCCSFITAHAQIEAQAPDTAISELEVTTAIQQLKQDPNLAPERISKILQWVESNKKQEASDSSLPSWLSWLRWMADLFQWLADSSRILFWTIIIIGVALLALFLLRLFKRGSIDTHAIKTTAPTHVRELDIRPESLPDNIGDAAWRLWMGNQHRAALALLYRGLLSRLVHAHTVPIRASSTELDCQRLASAKLSADRMQYVTQLLNIWRHAVYGGIEPSAEQVQQLCVGFAALNVSSSNDESIMAGVPS